MLNIKKIKGLMAENDFTQVDLAVSLGLTKGTIQNKMNGKTEFTASELVKMSKIFKVVTMDIFFIDNLPK